ncbi:hypothetical protein D915_002948 [Fasciola hepatica]|uniref:DRBM domain-containing protein n=1 Tax=Fasciola hepatica TaxID=6192 RepID=A0A4E0REN8_FASHE|nr:hypothetical protein D915_002948 [Fasciola hepatica]
MSDDLHPPTKRGRFKEKDINLMTDDPAAKRKQVDAHVQAFLKTVLDHANNSLLKTSKTRPTRRVRDVATQTDEISEDPEAGWPWDVKAAFNFRGFACGTTQHSNPSSLDSAFVPNRAMYSQETLQLVSQQEVYHNQLQTELAVTSDAPQCYYTSNALTEVAEFESSNSSGVDSGGVCRVISEWMEKYERWFYENFGVDMKSITASAQNVAPFPAPAQFPDKPNLLYPCQTVPSTTLATSSQQDDVVSGAPISYYVPEGSVCMPENHMFSPYVSLLPSFYTPAAFSHNLSAQHSLAISSVQLHNPIPPIFPPCQIASIEAKQQLGVQPQTLPTQSCTQIISTKPVVSSVVPSSISPVSMDNNRTTGPVTSFSDLPTELQTSAMLAALSIPVHNNRQPSMGQWGPLLRYGTYGRLPSPNEIQQLGLGGKTQASFGSSSEVSNGIESRQTASSFAAPSSDKMPPPPPTFILLRRQAMICALQLSCRERGRELFLREKEGISGLKVDFVNELKQVVEKNINVKPVFLFAKLNNLPKCERSYFLKNIQELDARSRGGQNPHLEPLDPAQMYACDLLIGDVLIAEACSTYKQQAQNCAARQAFKLLSQPCFLVGSVRRWELVDYLVLCLSSKADLVPKLPPFLSDPFESLSKKDRKIDCKNPNETFDVVNPKPPEDFWLYLADLPATALDDEIYWEKILSQSAEFSQMTVAFDVEVDTETGSFLCSALIDNHRYPPITGQNVSESQKQAVKELVKTLRQTQPVVGAVHSKSGSRWNPERLEPLWGVPERALIDTLMWGKEERDLAIDIEQLEAHCDVPELPESVQPDGLDPNSDHSTKGVQSDEDRYASPRHLENFVQAYAASALVTPLRLSSRTVPPRVWPLVRQIARNWGLLSCIENHFLADKINLCVLVCKRAPLPRLKRTLYERENYGCFTLLDRGNLQPDAKKRLLTVEPLVYDQIADSTVVNHLNVPVLNCNTSCSSLPVDDSDPYSEEPVTRLARHFIATAPKPVSVKNEPITCEGKQVFDDCVLLAAELNQPSSAIEILDDLPKTLIPGIDF